MEKNKNKKLMARGQRVSTQFHQKFFLWIWDVFWGVIPPQKNPKIQNPKKKIQNYELESGLKENNKKNF